MLPPQASPEPKYLPAHATSSPIAWTPESHVRLLDQTLLPSEERYLDLDSVAAVAEAIRTLRCAARRPSASRRRWASRSAARRDARGGRRAPRRRWARARPTAVNLPWAIDRMTGRADAHGGDARGAGPRCAPRRRRSGTRTARCAGASASSARRSFPAARTCCTHLQRGRARHGRDRHRARAGLHLHRRGRGRARGGRRETRPLLQGSRLTAWELSRAGVAVTVIADSMAAPAPAGEVDS